MTSSCASSHGGPRCTKCGGPAEWASYEGDGGKTCLRRCDSLPLVTIITPVAPDETGLLGRAVESVLAQSIAEWEWIICEDGPSFGAEKYAELDPRIHWINTQHGGGPAHARNLASAQARGAWIRNLDADDWLPARDTLQRSLDALAAHRGAQYLFGPVINHYVEQDGREEFVPSSIPAGALRSSQVFSFWRNNDYVHGVHPTTLMISSRLFFRCGGYGGLHSAEDSALVMRATQVADGVCADFPVTVHSKRPGSMTASSWHQDEAGRRRRGAFIERCAMAQLESCA